MKKARPNVAISPDSALLLTILSGWLDMPADELVDAMIRSAYHEIAAARVKEAEADPEPAYVEPSFVSDGSPGQEAERRIRVRVATRTHAERMAAWRARQAEKTGGRHVAS